MRIIIFAGEVAAGSGARSGCGRALHEVAGA